MYWQTPAVLPEYLLQPEGVTVRVDKKRKDDHLLEEGVKKSENRGPYRLVPVRPAHSRQICQYVSYMQSMCLEGASLSLNNNREQKQRSSVCSMCQLRLVPSFQCLALPAITPGLSWLIKKGANRSGTLCGLSIGTVNCMASYIIYHILYVPVPINHQYHGLLAEVSDLNY